MSSFRKRNVKLPIPGTRTSPHTGQVITSSGNPSLDVILGGGLPIGSICLIEEDKYVTHAKVLAKYFLAEGVLSQQSIFLGSLDDDPAEMLRKLPKPLSEEEERQEEQVAADKEQNGDATPTNGLRIAWRYNDLPMVNSEQNVLKIGHHFNLMEQIDPLLLDYAETAIWNDTNDEQDIVVDDEDEVADHFGNLEQEQLKLTDPMIAATNYKARDDELLDKLLETVTDKFMDIVPDDLTKKSSTFDRVSMNTTIPTLTNAETSKQKAQQPQQKEALKSIFENSKYLRLLNEIQSILHEDKFMQGAPAQKGLCRICITSLGSHLWYDEKFPKDILKFLTVLRATVRSVTAVCFITIPMHLVAKCDASLVPKIRNLVDYSIELESFAGSERETNPVFKEYNGLLHLHKATAINTLAAYMPETTDLAFKLRRKKFVIEKLHLPPELQESKHDENTAAAPTLSCGATTSPNPKATLDF